MIKGKNYKIKAEIRNNKRYVVVRDDKNRIQSVRKWSPKSFKLSDADKKFRTDRILTEGVSKDVQELGSKGTREVTLMTDRVSTRRKFGKNLDPEDQPNSLSTVNIPDRRVVQVVVSATTDDGRIIHARSSSLRSLDKAAIESARIEAQENLLLRLSNPNSPSIRQAGERPVYNIEDGLEIWQDQVIGYEEGFVYYTGSNIRRHDYMN